MNTEHNCKDEAYYFASECKRLRAERAKVIDYCRRHLHPGVGPAKQGACGEILDLMGVPRFEEDAK